MLKGPGTRGVWGHAPPENFEILVLWKAISSVLRGQILKAWLRVEVVDFILCFVRFLKLFWNRYHFQLSILKVCGMHQHGSCVNLLGIACGQYCTPTSCYFSWKHCWLVFSYHGEFSRFQVSKYIESSAYTGCISLYIYCLITCNIKSLLNVPKISHISRKISQVSRFPAKSPDSRNKFVFLPKQPLLELSAPIKNVRSSPSHEIQSTPPGIKASHLVFVYWFSFDEIGLTAQFFVGVNKA